MSYIFYLFLFLNFIQFINTTSDNGLNAAWYSERLSSSTKTIGVFNKKAPRLEGLKWGNWGSRPYEYYWASKACSINGLDVIDLGIGLPSYYNWPQYVRTALKPKFYAGIDYDGRILNELEVSSNFEIRYMDMSKLEYADEKFDVAYCISTFEHIPYPIFIKSIQEAYRVLKDDGLLIITLDERWDKNLPYTPHNNWNTLEQDLVASGNCDNKYISFGLPEFLHLVENYFVPINDDAVINLTNKTIYSKSSGQMYYSRTNRSPEILNSGEVYNSAVSYAILKKK